MKLRVAKKVSLARQCGPGCHRWGTIEHAFEVFARASRRRARMTVPPPPEMLHWSALDLSRCGYMVTTAIDLKNGVIGI